MKKILIKLLMCIMMGVLALPAKASGTSELDDVQNVFVNFDYKNQMLMDSRNFIHTEYVNKLRNDSAMFTAMEFVDRIADIGGQPKTEDYVKELVALLSLYDSVNAFDVQKERQQDDLKDLYDYLVDGTEIATSVLGLVAPGSDMPDLSDALLTAIKTLNKVIHVTDDRVEAYVLLETILQDYGSYREILTRIKSHAINEELEKAADLLIYGMDRAMETRLEIIGKADKEELMDLSIFFFTEFLWSSLKFTDDYATNRGFQSFVDGGGAVCNVVYGIIDSSASLGSALGKVVGNLLFGTENVLQASMEACALNDIGYSLLNASEYTRLYAEIIEEPNAEVFARFVQYAKFATACRTRGEYMMYRICCLDARLLKVFNAKATKEAEESYLAQVSWLEGYYDYLDRLGELAKEEYNPVLSLVNGRIVEDETDMAIANANVSLLSSDGKRSYETTSDENGCFQLSVRNLAYVLSIEKDGYGTKTTEIEIREDTDLATLALKQARTDSTDYAIERIDQSYRNDAGEVLIENWYDKVVVSDSNPCHEKINAWIEDYYADFLLDDEKLYEYSHSSFLPSNEDRFYNINEAEVSYNRNGILSIKAKKYWMMSGPQSYGIDGINIDLASGEILDLPSMLGESPAAIEAYFKAVTLDYFYNQTEEYTGLYDHNPLLDYDYDSFKWFIDENGEVFLSFDKYELTVGASGSQTIDTGLNIESYSSHKDTIIGQLDLYEGYWCSSPQYLELVKFEPDGYAYFCDYHVDEDFRIVIDGSTSQKAHQYFIVGDKIALLYRLEYPVLLAVCTKESDIEWDNGMLGRIQALPSGEAFMYETNWVPHGFESDNALLIERYHSE